MKAALVYTSTTPELIQLSEAEVRKNIGPEAELLSYENPDVLSITREAGYVTKEAAAMLYEMYLGAVRDGADAILNMCSSVGEAADAAQDMACYLGVPIVRIDLEMCRDAVRLGTRIGVMATLPTTLTPTCNTIQRMARELDREVVLTKCLVDGAFGLNREEFKKLMVDHARSLQGKVDVILLCQGSMAYCEELIRETLGCPVCSSPRYGAIELRRALAAKGLIDQQ